MDYGLCKFRHMFGKEGQGFHQQRFILSFKKNENSMFNMAFLICLEICIYGNKKRNNR